MKILWQGRTLDYDPGLIDVKTGVVVAQHTGMGLKSWSKAVDDLHPVAVQALMWVVLTQNGERHDIYALNFSVTDFMAAFNAAAIDEMVAIAEAEAATDPQPVAGEDGADASTQEPTPTSAT